MQFSAAISEYLWSHAIRGASLRSVIRDRAEIGGRGTYGRTFP